MDRIKKPEILAPAGSMESLKAAVSAGCDAIYIGGSKFGARAYADNPQGDAMIEAIRYCHLHGVRIYMTVNTLLKDRELYQELYDYILPYYREGLDAVIVQDVGVMRYLHSHFPKLELHASTQMTLTMGKCARLLESYGVTRMVPARELTIEELQQMRKDTELELEVFVHGALCYCYSGQCLFSSMLGGRSGNRGRCAQPCRMPYELLEKESLQSVIKKQEIGDYVLSPKENCNLGHVGALIEAGVDSFKIEGRMKRPEYTAFTTAMYRKYVDLYFELGKEGYEIYTQKHQNEWQEDLRKLGELYNRGGFSSGYLEGKAGVPNEPRQGKGEMLSSLRPKHGGIRVGKVLSVDKHTVTYQLERELHSQDVVEFRDNQERPSYEYTIGEKKNAGEKVTARYLKGSRILTGDMVYRTKDACLLEEIRQNYIEREAKVSLSCRFEGKEEQCIILEVWCHQKEEKYQVKVLGDCCQKAQKQPASMEGIQKLLYQTGDTPFVIEECQIDLQDGLFIPVGAVKKLRREAMAQMQEQLETKDCRDLSGVNDPANNEIENYIQRNVHSIEVKEEKQQKEIVRIASVLSWEQFEAAVAAENIQEIYLKMDQLPDERLREAVIKGNGSGKVMYLELPAIFRKAVYEAENKKLNARDSLYKMEQLSGFVVRNMESFFFLKEEAGIDASRIILDHTLYLMNREAYAYWKEQGCKKMTLPFELTGREIQELLPMEGIEAVIYTCIPVMTSAQCVRFNALGCEQGNKEKNRFLILRDRKNREFAVFNACKYCYNVIYQKEPLELCEEMKMQGIWRFRYDFSMESGEETTRILAGNIPNGQKGHFYSGIE